MARLGRRERAAKRLAHARLAAARERFSRVRDPHVRINGSWRSLEDTLHQLYDLHSDRVIYPHMLNFIQRGAGVRKDPHYQDKNVKDRFADDNLQNER